MFGLDLFLVKKVLSWAIEFAVKNWRIITSAVLLAGTFAAGWYNGSDSVKRDWEVDIHLRVKEQLAAVEKNQKLLVALEETKNANLKTISTLRTQLAVERVYLPPSSCGGLDTTSGSKDEVAGSGVVPVTPQVALDNFIKGLGEEAYRADEIVESCRVLRAYAASFNR